MPGSRPISFMTVIPASLALKMIKDTLIYDYIWNNFLLRLIIFHHCRRDIRSGHDVFFMLNSSLDHLGVIDVWNQTRLGYEHLFLTLYAQHDLPNSNIILSDQILDSFVIINITRDSDCTGKFSR